MGREIMKSGMLLCSLAYGVELAGLTASVGLPELHGLSRVNDCYAAILGP